MIKGIKRLRQAIKNQQDAGGGEFRLAYHDAEEIADEIEEEFGWAQGVPTPVDADGEVVPITTDVMYDDDGEKLEGSIYKSFIWSRERDRWYFGVLGGSRGVASLHLARPDSWERIEEDIRRCRNQQTSCAYYGREENECVGCPSVDIPWCIGSMANDVLRRAKALAERDAKASTPQPSPHEAKGAGRA